MYSLLNSDKPREEKSIIMFNTRFTKIIIIEYWIVYRIRRTLVRKKSQL
jgi:hypothetical protein